MMNEMKIDVVLLTKNSVSRNAPGVFEESLESIMRNVPVNQLIVVDGFSKDGTLDLIHQFFSNVKVIRTRALRGKAREIGIKHVKTSHFMFVDDDVILCKDWFNKAFQYFNNSSVGAVWGADIPWSPRLEKDTILTCDNVRTHLAELMISNFKIRGGTHDILIRTDIVKDMKIPRGLHLFEDNYIKQYIENKGFKVIATSDPYCIHKRKCEADQWDIDTGVQMAYLRMKYGRQRKTFYYMAKNFLRSFPKTFLIWRLSKDYIPANKQLLMYYYMFLGYLKARFGLNLKR